MAETRFLGWSVGARNRVSLPDLGKEAKVMAETRFLN